LEVTAATIPSSADNDSINGTGGDDLIYGILATTGAPGNDTLPGQGNDEITGDPGNNIVYGNLGNDVLFGGERNNDFRASKRRLPALSAPFLGCPPVTPYGQGMP
jgi:Ca2+-binding RTX toxin-like protein